MAGGSGDLSLLHHRPARGSGLHAARRVVGSGAPPTPESDHYFTLRGSAERQYFAASAASVIQEAAADQGGHRHRARKGVHPMHWRVPPPPFHPLTPVEPGE